MMSVILCHSKTVLPTSLMLSSPLIAANWILPTLFLYNGCETLSTSSCYEPSMSSFLTVNLPLNLTLNCLFWKSVHLKQPKALNALPSCIATSLFTSLSLVILLPRYVKTSTHSGNLPGTYLNWQDILGHQFSPCCKQLGLL